MARTQMHQHETQGRSSLEIKDTFEIQPTPSALLFQSLWGLFQLLRKQLLLMDWEAWAETMEAENSTQEAHRTESGTDTNTLGD